MISRLVLLTLITVNLGCASRTIADHEIEMLVEVEIPMNCKIVDSFQAYAHSRIKSFYLLSDHPRRPREVTAILYNEEETRKYRKKIAKLEGDEARRKYSAKYPDKTVLPIDFFNVVVQGYRRSDKSIRRYTGLLLDCGKI